MIQILKELFDAFKSVLTLMAIVFSVFILLSIGWLPSALFAAFVASLIDVEWLRLTVFLIISFILGLTWFIFLAKKAEENL